MNLRKIGAILILLIISTSLILVTYKVCITQDSALAILEKSSIIGNIDKILEANLLIINYSAKCLGSGTRILIKGEHYILTCAHLMDNLTDCFLIKDENFTYFTRVVKIDKEHDLMLLTSPIKDDKMYLEIATEEPKIGSQVYVVGNPDSMPDIITEGIIAQKYKYYYIITNKMYFGNSGGALIYKNQIVGVVNSLTVVNKEDVYVNYGFAVNLATIQDFLKRV